MMTSGDTPTMERDITDEMLTAAGWEKSTRSEIQRSDTIERWGRVVGDTLESVGINEGSIEYSFCRFIGNGSKESFSVEWTNDSRAIRFTGIEFPSEENPFQFCVLEDRSSYLICQETPDRWKFPASMTQDEYRAWMAQIPGDDSNTTAVLGMFGATPEILMK